MACCPDCKNCDKKHIGDFFWLAAFLAGIAALFIFIKQRKAPKSSDRIVPIHPEVVSSIRTGAAEENTPRPKVLHEIPLAPGAPESKSVDDLTIIDGIGPKIAAFLAEQKITSFSQLAGTSVEKLADMLQNAGFRLARPATWPEQARLAAAGKLDEMAEFIKKAKIR